jgi:hypothetical protein
MPKDDPVVEADSKVVTEPTVEDATTTLPLSRFDGHRLPRETRHHDDAPTVAFSSQEAAKPVSQQA